MTYKKFSPARRPRDGAFSLESLENGGGCDLSARCCRGIFGHSADMLFKGKWGIGGPQLGPRNLTHSAFGMLPGSYRYVF